VNRTVGRRVAAALLIGAAAWFLADAVVSQWQALREHEWRIEPLRMVASVSAHVLVLAWGVVIWGEVLRRFSDVPAPHRILLRIWFLSNLAKYIPGKIFQFIAVAQLARGAGLPARVLVASLLVHTALALLAAALLSTYTLAAVFLPGTNPAALAVGATVLGCLLVHPAPLNLALAALGRVTRRDLTRWRGRWSDGLLLLVLSLVNWVFYGLAYYLFVSSLTPLPLGTLPVLSGVNALSFVAGYLAIVTPGGLGVREAAMTALLLPLLPRSVGALLAVASRLWTIVAEVIGGLLVLALGRYVDAAPGRKSEGRAGSST
jgi:glycosyltransferase 2 family protein